MENNHTPGPWSVGYKNGATHIFAASGESIMCDETYYPWVPDNFSDWYLIAAAPELLKSLEMALIWLEYEGKYDIQGIRMAVAKAKGQIK